MSKRLIIILAIIGLLLDFKAQAYSTFSNGTLIKGSGPEVYVLEHGSKRWIVSPAVFNNLFYNWEKIIKVADSTLNIFPNGAKIDRDFSDGALLKAEKSPKVYLCDKGNLRWIPDPYVFNSNNFSWENIVIVSDKTITRKTKSVDVKSGEFLLLPTTFITEKPPSEINFKKAIFSYSGTNPTGSVSELKWETFLDGYDASWQGASANYTRAIDLPAVNKTYTFYARSRNKDGKIDPYPAFYTFKVINFSSLYKKIKISGVKSRGSFELDEYMAISNSSKENIDIIGFVFKNQKGETLIISRAVEKLYLQADDFAGDIILESGKNATIFSGFSPIGKNFRLNKCAGYLNYFYNFSPKLREECPKPLAQDLTDFAKNCRDYINSLKPCAPPNTSDIRITYDKQCTDYLIDTFNYSNCVIHYQADPDFLKNDWYLYLNRGSGYLNDRHDEIKLYDRDNNLVDSYSY